MKKISFTLNYSKKNLLHSIIRDYENVSYFPKINGWNIEIFSLKNLNENCFFKENLGSITNFKVDFIKKKKLVIRGKKKSKIC